MDSNKILQSDILDIVFEGKNKEYGAYQLRKTYNGRLMRALAMMLGVIVVVFLSSWVVAKKRKNVVAPLYVDSVTLFAPPPEPATPPPPPPPPVQAPPPQVAMKQFTPPRLVKEEVPEDEKPPVQDDLKDVKIGAVNQKGNIDDGTIAPPAPGGDGGKGIIEAPKKKDDDEPLMTVEIESTYPGGQPAWSRYLNKNLRYPDDAVNNEIQGPVMVQFVVDRDGNVSDVTVLSGPENGGLREEAVRVIKKSGKWNPGVQNGIHVKSYKRQVVTFKLGTE